MFARSSWWIWLLVVAYSEGSATITAAAGAAAPERPGELPGGFLYARLGCPGRIWAHILCFFSEGFTPFDFGCVDNSQHWFVALIVLVGFSTCESGVR